MNDATLRLGTCSWKFPSWAGLVYSKARGIDYLGEYAFQFDTVEIDQWFWSLFGDSKIGMPKEADVGRYREAVPERFRFTIKAPNSITLTHYYRQDRRNAGKPNPYFLSQELLQDFLTRIEPLKELTAAVMFQFEYLNKKKMAGLEDFLERLGAFTSALPTGWHFAMETRNPQYLKPEYFDFLRARGLSAVFVQGYYLPPVFDLLEDYATELPGPCIIRLMGPDRAEIEKQTGKKWGSVVAPKDEELDRLAEIIPRITAGGTDVIVNVNNHYEGSAPQTVARLRDRLGTS